MPVPADSDTIFDLVVPDERPLLPAAGTTRTLESGETTDVRVNPLVEHVFLAAIEQRGLVHVHMTDVPRMDVDLGDLTALGRVEISWSVRSAHAAVVALDDGCVALLAGRASYCDIVVGGRDPQNVRGACERLAETLRAEPIPDDRVAMRFWTATGHGGTDVRRAIAVPEWAEVARNYPVAVRPAMADLLAARGPGGGALILWYGPPGTGKTHAVQVLAGAWRDWCSVHCVTDPEALLQSTPYLMDVVDDPLGDDERAWRLLVLEDAGELMAASARAEVGQGLSRLLNLTDGLLGQGVRCILLVTTNEPIGRLHPAVRRPGRCWASIDFGPFGVDEANTWLALRGSERTVRGPSTLAELYAIAEDRELGHEAPGEGFGFARALTR